MNLIRDFKEDINGDEVFENLVKLFRIERKQTFPAYEDTEIQARSKEALENARLALENAKRSAGNTEPVDTDLQLSIALFDFTKTLGGN